MGWCGWWGRRGAGWTVRGWRRHSLGVGSLGVGSLGVSSPAWGGGARLPGGRTRQNAACSGDAPVGEWLAAPSVATLGMSAVPVLTVGGGGFL